jgi:hypothetical protein
MILLNTYNAKVVLGEGTAQKLTRLYPYSAARAKTYCGLLPVLLL